MIPLLRGRAGSLSENWFFATVRYSGMLYSQTRATAGLLCGWIPAKSMPE